MRRSINKRLTKYHFSNIIGTYGRNFVSDLDGTENDVIFRARMFIEDHTDNVNNFLIPITTNLTGYSGSTASETHFIRLQVTGNEKPGLNLWFSAENFYYYEKRSGYVPISYFAI